MKVLATRNSRVKTLAGALATLGNRQFLVGEIDTAPVEIRCAAISFEFIRGGLLCLRPPLRLSVDSAFLVDGWLLNSKTSLMLHPWQAILLWLALFVLGSKAGAADGSRHWAFQPVQRPTVPTLTNSERVRSPIDAFILAKTLDHKLAPRADKPTLIRRATFDLTGLPPTPAEIEHFLADESPDAFSKLVDRLLTSPHYGEHVGRLWLDVVRYADTAGETADYPVPVAWRYRNYVIESFNNDKPYDEFLGEQIAGDILARQSKRFAEQVTATGFLAISRRFGFDSENYHHLTIQDTIDTLGQSVMGLSLGCARCHDHKYDPISMAEYYGLYGIFASTRYAFPGSEQKQKYRSLAPLDASEVGDPAWRQFEQRIASLIRKLEQAKQPVPAAVLRSLSDIDGDFELQAPAAGGSRGVLVPPWVYEGAIAVTREAQSPFRNLHPMGKVGAALPTNRYEFSQALHPARSHETGGQIYLNFDFRLATNIAPGSGRHKFWIGSRGALSSPAIEILISPDTISLRSGDNQLKSLAAIRPGVWHNVQFTLDLTARTVVGELNTIEEKHRVDAQPLLKNWNGAVNYLSLMADIAGTESLTAMDIDNIGVQSTPIPPVTPDSSKPDQPATETRAALSKAEIDQIRRELDAALAEGPAELAYAVMEGTPHNARIQLRGDPHQLGNEVPRGFIRVLGGGTLPPETDGSGRLELARWLTRPDHPLTARVLVNRLWQHHFGRGLVATPNDFGTRGQPPTHPELLDYLASRFVEGGWSIKAMHRLIMNSDTYQQSSGTMPPTAPVTTLPLASSAAAKDRHTVETFAADARSGAFTPFPRRRLTAEQIRDAILYISGALDSAPGRGHAFPQPTTWGYTQHTPFSAVYDHNKRSVYLMAQRLKRHPLFALFDGPDPNASTGTRTVSTVPTQALYFMNAPFVHEQAVEFAHRLEQNARTDAERINAGYLCALGRLPTDIERAEAVEFMTVYRTESRLLGIQQPDQAALAAWARALFASNEFLHLD